jgi:hypothetical protein
METYDETEEEVRKNEPDKEEWKMQKRRQRERK